MHELLGHPSLYGFWTENHRWFILVPLHLGTPPEEGSPPETAEARGRRQSLRNQRHNGPPLATQLGFTKCHIETNLQIDNCPKKRATTNNPGCSIHSLTCFLPIQGECLEMHKEKGNSL